MVCKLFNVLAITVFCTMGILAVTVSTPASHDVKPNIVAEGSFDNEADNALEGAVPHVITDKATLDKLWATWKVARHEPTVDFSKHIVIASTTVGSLMSPSFILNSDGNLQDVGMASMDLLPGFRYKISIVSREGVLKVNGNPLPAVKPTAATAAQAAGILMDGPKPDSTVSNPIQLSGKATVFEGTLSIEIQRDNGDVITRTFTTAVGDTGTFRCRVYYNQPLAEAVKGKIVIYSTTFTEDGQRKELFRTEIPVMLTSTREIDSKDKKVHP